MNKKGILIVILVSICLGIMVVRQLVLSQKINSEVKAETNQALAYEVSELFKANEQLNEEVDKLQGELDKLNKIYLDSKQANEALEAKINNYKIISGTSEITGPGVKITFDKKIASTQVIDLINNLKNIGVEAIAMNGQRIVASSSIANGVFSPPVTILAIGDKDLLYNSLNRSGGIMAQIGYGQVATENDIIIPSI